MRSYGVRYSNVWLFVLIFAMILTACKSEPTASPTIPPSAPSEESIPSPAPATTLTPVPTPVPERGKIVLLGSIDQAGELPFPGIQSMLQDLAEQNNLIFEPVASMSPAELTDDIKIVVALPPDPGMAELSAARQSIQFLAIGISGLQPSANLSIVGGAAATADRQGFVAGYLAAVISDEWRTGMIALGDSEPGQLARQGFINGVTYYCGLCRSPYPPFYSYPIMVDLPSSASAVEAQSAAETIISQAVKTVFVYPGAGDQAMLERLAQAGINIVGGIELPPSLDENWVASINADPLTAVSEIWPELLAGQGGMERSLAITLVDRNERLFSVGRQQLVEEFLADLQAGFIDTGVIETP